ncbi:hypothetical protein HDU92_007049 [Lobulomyces angularis]|nr:hypothetical protein HDU92_007049 [Lobulomyces angularis]
MELKRPIGFLNENDVLRSFFIAETILKNLGISAKNLAQRNHLANEIFAIYKNTEISFDAITTTISLLYLSRLALALKNDTFKKNFNRSSINPFKSWITSLLLADTFLNDFPAKITVWATVLKYSPADILKMRCQMLNAINFKLAVTDSELQDWFHYIEISFTTFKQKLYKLLDKSAVQRKKSIASQQVQNFHKLKFKKFKENSKYNKALDLIEKKRISSNLLKFNSDLKNENIALDDNKEKKKYIFEQHRFLCNVLMYTDLKMNDVKLNY